MIEPTPKNQTVMPHADPGRCTAWSHQFAFAVLIGFVFFAGAAIAQVDTDGDLIPDDGDSSGSPYDNPCPLPGGILTDCDDNCRTVSNPLQIDVLPPFGVGDACQEDPVDTDFLSINLPQQTDTPSYRWKGSGDPYQPPAVAVSTTLSVPTGGTCEFVQIETNRFTVPGQDTRVRFTVPAPAPYGGLACCAWEAECDLMCASEAAPSNDCDAGVTCEIFSDSIFQCANALYPTINVFDLDAFQQDDVRLALQDPNGECSGFAGVPHPSCCFTNSKTVDYYWGSEAGNLLEGVDTDSDGTPDGCDNCVNVANVNQADADGDASGDACDANDANKYACSDVDSDGCDDCSYGSFNPAFDGAVNPPNGICVPEPGFLSMLLIGIGAVAFIGKRREGLPGGL